MRVKECEICYNNYCENNFKILDCKHQLCSDCYNKLNSFVCPFCRAPIQDFKYYLEITIEDLIDCEHEIPPKTRHKKKKYKKVLRIHSELDYISEIEDIMTETLKKNINQEIKKNRKNNLRNLKNFV